MALRGRGRGRGRGRREKGEEKRDAYLHPPRCAPEEGKGCMERETEKETEKG